MRRHGTDLVSLVFGLIFLIISAWWLASRFVDINVPHLGWFAAAALIALGLLGVASSLRGDRSDQEPATSGLPGERSDQEAATSSLRGDQSDQEPAPYQPAVVATDDPVDERRDID